MTTEPKSPEFDSAASATMVGEETVALTRRHSAITKRLTRKQTIRRIDALKAMATTISGEETAAAII